MLRRIVTTIVVFFLVVNLDFFLPRLAPGNAAQILATGTRLPVQAVKLLSERFGLNQPIYVQYVLFLKGVFLTWPPDFGFSFQYYPQSVSAVIVQRIGWSVLLLASSLLLAGTISFVLAAISSLRRSGKFELGAIYTSVTLWSIPAFWTGMVLIWVFAVDLHLFPVSGNVNPDATPGMDYALSVVAHSILPIVTLAAVVYGHYYVVLRGASVRTLKNDFVLTAQARGLKSRTIAFKYILRNSLLPVISLSGYSLSAIISAVVLVEYVFSYPGVGDIFIDGVFNRDYPILEGALFYTSLLVLTGALLGDFLLTRLDPRLR